MSVQRVPPSEPQPGGSVQRGRRAAARARLALPGRAVSFDGTKSCLVLDVSQTGAQIGCEDVPKVGAMVVIEVSSVELFGTVAWVRGNHYGLDFDEPLAHETVVDLRHQADAFDRTERARLLKLAEEFVVGRV